jgi:phosphoribosylamine-glycine ligase
LFCPKKKFGTKQKTITPQANAYALLQKIDWENAYYRTDIGFKAISS